MVKVRSREVGGALAPRRPGATYWQDRDKGLVVKKDQRHQNTPRARALGKASGRSREESDSLEGRGKMGQSRKWFGGGVG